MFSIKMTRPDGVSKVFPLDIYKESIMIGRHWKPVAGIFVSEEAEDFVGFSNAGEYIHYAYLEGSAVEGDIDIDDDRKIFWLLLLDGKPCSHKEFSTAAFNYKFENEE